MRRRLVERPVHRVRKVKDHPPLLQGDLSAQRGDAGQLLEQRINLGFCAKTAEAEAKGDGTGSDHAHARLKRGSGGSDFAHARRREGGGVLISCVATTE